MNGEVEGQGASALGLGEIPGGSLLCCRVKAGRQRRPGALCLRPGWGQSRPAEVEGEGQ